jgi:hypothetical protein
MTFTLGNGLSFAMPTDPATRSLTSFYLDLIRQFFLKANLLRLSGGICKLPYSTALSSTTSSDALLLEFLFAKHLRDDQPVSFMTPHNSLTQQLKSLTSGIT